MNKEAAGMRCAGMVILAWLGCSAAARADVTIQQNTTLDVASMVRMHGTTTESIVADKKRSDTESHCEGLLSMVCGNQHGGEIVRLDRDVTWHLEPDKKRYREDVFATPEQLKMMRARMEAMQEKMRSCPVPQSQAAPVDKSKCEMSPPKFDVRKTDESKTIAGHDAQRTVLTLTESCTDKQTGDVCDTVVAFDLWLTQDSLPGSADQKAFQHAYAQKLGLDDPQGVMRGQVDKFLAAYHSQIQQLAAKSSDLKGQPLRTGLRVLIGGEHCASAAKMKDQTPAGGGSNTLADAFAGRSGCRRQFGGRRSERRRARRGEPGRGVGSGRNDRRICRRRLGGQADGRFVQQEKSARCGRSAGRDASGGQIRRSLRFDGASGPIHDRDRIDQHRCRSAGSLRHPRGLDEGDPQGKQRAPTRRLRFRD